VHQRELLPTPSALEGKTPGRILRFGKAFKYSTAPATSCYYPIAGVVQNPTISCRRDPT
jgi:hypothetical protein